MLCLKLKFLSTKLDFLTRGFPYMKDWYELDRTECEEILNEFSIQFYGFEDLEELQELVFSYMEEGVILEHHLEYFN